MRAKIGAFAIATASMIWGRPLSSQATMPIARRMPGIASMTSVDAHQDRVDLAAEAAGERADEPPDGQRRGRPTTTPTDEADLGPVDHPAELVATLHVGAHQVRGLGGWRRSAREPSSGP